MLPFDQMPEDNAALADLSVDFPRLETDEAESCPVRREDILRYLADEVPGGGRLSWADLRFLRTAQVEESAYWVWRFIEPGPRGEPAYLTVSVRAGTRTIGYEPDAYGLTPEQYLLGDYHNVF